MLWDRGNGYKMYVFKESIRRCAINYKGRGRKEVIYLHRQNMVPYQWPQWLVVDVIGAQLRAFGNSTD